MAVGGMIDDEIELRPVLGGLADIGDVGEASQIGKRLLYPRREQPLVDADVLAAFLHHLLVTLVGDFLVVHPPGITADVLMGVVADGVALAGLRLEREASVELVEPAGLPRR